MSKRKFNVRQSRLEEVNQSLVIGIGASAGGIEALMAFFEQVPADSNLSYVVILHLSPDFDSQLVQILQNVTAIPVTQVTEQVEVLPNRVYVIPPNQHLVMREGHLSVFQNISMEERRAPVDIFFRTLADSHGGRAVAVVLSGTGANGSMGLKRIKERGGAVFVQDPVQATFSEMPRNAIATELVDEVLPVADIPAKLLSYSKNLGSVIIPTESNQRPQNQQQALREIFTQMRLRTGHDFSNYKRPTLLRRIERRIHVHDLPSLPAYAAYLRERPEEAEALLKDLLISVTNFFRDEAAFQAVEHQVISKLMNEKKTEDIVRIWVAACATGEEAYSLAMILAERTLGMIDAPRVQIFATDIDEEAINTAREGLYSINDAADVPPDRLRRFFTLEGERYRVSREIREMVLFAHHNVLKDPPFSRLDVITCRNLLIYLNHTAQERVMETFHFALNPGGYLVLGLSETADNSKDLFAQFSRENHIYQSRFVSSRRYPVPESVPALLSHRRPPASSNAEIEEQSAVRMNFGDLHQRMLEQYAPPSVIVNEEHDILHFTDRAGRYLHFSGGELSRNLLKLIRPELRLELRTAFYQASERQMNIEVPDLSLRLDDKTETLTLHVRPVLGEGDPARGYFLVLFETTGEASSETLKVITTVEPMAQQLEAELIRVKAQLRASNEQHDHQAEALKASNEELQAMNEELRSAAEELETSKEELQSINEELTTVNQELKVKIDEVSLSSDNLRNLVNSTHIATLFLDRNLRVNLFTPITREIFNLIPSDQGRPLTDITHRLAYDKLAQDAEDVLTRLQPVEREVSTNEGNALILRILPYRTADDRINGVVLTLIDISRRKAAEENLRKSEEQFRHLLLATSDIMFKMNADWSVLTHLQGSSQLLESEQPSRSWMELWILPEDRADVLAHLQPAIELKTAVELEQRVIRRDGTPGWMFFRAIPLLDKKGQIIEWFGAASDITQRKQAEEALKEANKQKDRFMALLAHELRNPISTLSNATLLLEATNGTDPEMPLESIVPTMKREVQYLTRLVNDLMDNSRVNLGKTQLIKEKHDIVALLKHVFVAVQPLINQAGQRLSTDLPAPPLYVDMDAVRITQVFRNLIGNAIKFTPVGGKIEIKAQQGDGKIRVDITDSGIGIAPEDISRIFLQFMQVNETHSEQRNGLGLGLSLVKEIVQMHEGRVAVQSLGVGHGSTFSVFLPLSID